jgi:hypothetical protein
VILPTLVGTLPARLDPTNGEARSWLRDELAKSAYRDTRDPFTKALQAIERWLSDLLNGVHAPTRPLPTFVAGLVAVAVVALIAYVLRFVRRTRRAPAGPPAALLGGEHLTAAEYRARAMRELAQQWYAACLLDVLRATALDAVERTLLEDAPSLTAHEIAGRLAGVFPTVADDLRWAADRFDAIAYGDASATRAEAERMVALDRTVSSARPVRADEPHDRDPHGSGPSGPGALTAGISA